MNLLASALDLKFSYLVAFKELVRQISHTRCSEGLCYAGSVKIAQARSLINQ